MALAQAQDKSHTQVAHLPSLQCRQILRATNAVTIVWENFTRIPCPVVPTTYRRLVCDNSGKLLYPGVAASLRLVAA